MERFKLIGAVHIFLVRDNQILLLRRYNTGYEDGNFSVPAGHMDGSETVVDAAIREAREECGIDMDPDDLQVVGVMHRKSVEERIDFFLVASQWRGVIANMEPDRCDELSWHSVDALPDKVIPYVQSALANYRRGEWFSEFGFDDHL